MSSTTLPATVTANISTTASALDDGGPPPFILFQVSYMWYSMYAVLVVLIVGLSVSFCTGMCVHCLLFIGGHLEFFVIHMQDSIRWLR